MDREVSKLVGIIFLIMVLVVVAGIIIYLSISHPERRLDVGANIESIDDWIQYYYDLCAVDPQDPCSDVLSYSDGTPYYYYAPRKTEYLYVDDIVVYTK